MSEAGWRSSQMVRCYARSAAAERGRAEHARLNIGGDRVTEPGRYRARRRAQMSALADADEATFLAVSDMQGMGVRGEPDDLGEGGGEV
jgi:hypothetical protein